MEVILNEAAFLWKLLKVAVLAILHDGNNNKKSYHEALFKMILMINGKNLILPKVHHSFEGCMYLESLGLL